MAARNKAQEIHNYSKEQKEKSENQ